MMAKGLCKLVYNPSRGSMGERAKRFIERHIVHHIRDLGMKEKAAVAAAFGEARAAGLKVPKAPWTARLSLAKKKQRRNVKTKSLIAYGVIRYKGKRIARRRWPSVQSAKDWLASYKLLPGMTAEVEIPSLERKRKKNPAGGNGRARANKLPVIGDDLGAVEYFGGDGKRSAEQLAKMGIKGSTGRGWRHDFKKTGAKLLGLSDGSVLIKRGRKRLWSMFGH